MKPHLLRFAVAVLTFVVGCSVATILMKPASETGVIPLVATPSEAPSAWTVLLAKQNHDLKQISGSEKAQLQMAVETLLGATEDQSLKPRLFSSISTFPSEQRYVLIEEAPIVFIPGDSRLRVSIFSPDGKLLDSSEFGAGWRIMTTDMRFIQVKGIAGQVLEVESLPVINGADVRRQYYAVVGDKMRLIRLEDSKQALHHNTYYSPNHTIGSTEVGRSAADWEKSLITKDDVAVLATLTWLGGAHLNVDDEVMPGHWHEDLSEARLVEEVRARPGVKKAVNALKDSPNEWVREAARLAAKQMQ